MANDMLEEEEFCPNCGHFLEGEDVCPNCGAVLKHDDEFGDYDDEGSFDDEL
jgi:rubrerythrin